MNWVDILTILLVVLLIVLVLFYKWVYPRLRHQKNGRCAACNRRRAVSMKKSYLHEKKKQERKQKNK